jgi:hypothetical protein
MRLKRDNDTKDGVGLNNKKLDWEHDLKDNKLSKIEKVNAVQEKAKKLENGAKDKEKLLRAKGGADLIETNEVNQMLIEAIEAKLAILDEC